MTNLLQVKKFSKELKNNIKLILDNPYMYPPSYYFNYKDVRDMTYKKYTIVYQVSLERNTIEMMKIFKKNKPQCKDQIQQNIGAQ